LELNTSILADDVLRMPQNCRYMYSSQAQLPQR